MTHKIYWAERGLRYLYEVVTAELFMYTFCMIFMRQDPRFVDAIWIAGIFLLSYLIRDFAPNHILLTVGHLVLAGLLVILPGTVWIRTVTGIYDIGYLLPCAVAYAKRGSRLTDMSEPWPSILAGIIVYFASIGMELPVLSNLSYIAVALLMAIYMMIRYIQGLKRYISQTTEVSEQSIRDIAFINGRVVLFLAVLGVVAKGIPLNPKNPAETPFEYVAGNFGQILFGVVIWAASITSVIGAAYTSVSFLTSLCPTIERNRNCWIIGFIVVSTAVLVTVGKPAAVLVFVGTLNGLILPIALALILLAAYRSNIVGSYKHPICLAFAGWFVVIIMAILSGKTIISYVSSFVS